MIEGKTEKESIRRDCPLKRVTRKKKTIIKIGIR